jgi:MazG family protein
MTDSVGALFERLLAIMVTLRGPGGCPWDREQTPASLKAYLLEEAHEVLEAIDSSVPADLEEELGDLLFQVVFHAELAAEQGLFTMREVLERLVAKMVGRHPHVFGDARVATAGAALAQWEAIKQREAGDAGRRRSVLDGVPRALPALLRAQRIQSKAARVRFDWPDAVSAWDKVDEELGEVRRALAGGDRARLREELGDMLFSLVNVARLADLDAEEALRGAVEKFRRRFTEMEADLIARGISFGTVSQAELEGAWEAVKAREQGSAAASDAPPDRT